MVRDFTEDTKERLSKEIDDINKKTWNPVTDFIGDLFLYGGKWIGILSLKDDMSNVESYQRSVLDMTDMTKKQLNDIFENVYAVDRDYKDKILDLVNREKYYNAKLQTLISAIQPDFHICDAQKIREMVSGYNAQLKIIDGKINKDFEAELDWAAKRAALEGVKGTVGGVLRVAVDVLTLPANMIMNMTTNNYGAIITDSWALIDDTFAVAGNLGGLGALGVGCGIAVITGNKETKNYAISYGGAYTGASGLTDTLEAQKKVEGKSGVTSLFLKASKTMDATSAALGLYSDAKGFLEEPSKMIDTNFGFTKYEPLKKADMVEEYKDDYLHWQALYRHFYKDNHYAIMKNISKGYDYLENGWELLDDGWSAAVEGAGETVIKGFNKWYKAWGDSIELGKDYAEVWNEIFGFEGSKYGGGGFR